MGKRFGPFELLQRHPCHVIFRSDKKIAGGGLPSPCLLNNPARKLRHRGTGTEFELQINIVSFGERFFHRPHAFDSAHGAGAPTKRETTFLLSPLDELWQSLRKDPPRCYRDRRKQSSEHWQN